MRITERVSPSAYDPGPVPDWTVFVVEVFAVYGLATLFSRIQHTVRRLRVSRPTAQQVKPVGGVDVRVDPPMTWVADGETVVRVVIGVSPHAANDKVVRARSDTTASTARVDIDGDDPRSGLTQPARPRKHRV